MGERGSHILPGDGRPADMTPMQPLAEAAAFGRQSFLQGLSAEQQAQVGTGCVHCLPCREKCRVKMLKATAISCIPALIAKGPSCGSSMQPFSLFQFCFMTGHNLMHEAAARRLLHQVHKACTCISALNSGLGDATAGNGHACAATVAGSAALPQSVCRHSQRLLTASPQTCRSSYHSWQHSFTAGQLFTAANQWTAH